MLFYIDITNSSGTRYGGGPITSASYWRSTARVDRIGGFEFAMPASDEKAAEIQHRRYAYCYAIIEGEGPIPVGSGIIDRIETRPDNNGNVELVVSGDDLLRELTWRTVGRLYLSSGANLATTHANAVTLLGLKFPAGWSTIDDDAPPNDDIYYQYVGESCFAAVLKAGELSRCHVWMPSARVVRFQSAWGSNRFRAIEAPANPNLRADNLCLISELSAVEDTYDLITRIYPYGPEIPDSGEFGNELLNLDHATKSAPTGYTMTQDAALQWYLERDSAAATYGQIEAWISYNDIRASANTAAIVESAGNQLFDAALWELQRRSEPASFYTLSLSHAPEIIHPMQTIRCVFRRAVDGRNVVTIDETLFVMGATTTVDADGLRTTQLDVATVDRWPPSDIDPMRKLKMDNQRQING